MSKRKYDSTVARIAGNILSGYKPEAPLPESAGELTIAELQRVKWAVAMARAVVEEVRRTELPDAEAA